MPPMPLNNVLTNGQPQTYSALRRCLGIGRTIKWLKNMLLLFFGYTRPRILYGDQRFRVLPLECHFDRTFRRRILDGVPYQVRDNLAQAVSISLQHNRSRWQVQFYLAFA